MRHVLTVQENKVDVAASDRIGYDDKTVDVKLRDKVELCVVH